MESCRGERRDISPRRVERYSKIEEGGASAGDEASSIVNDSQYQETCRGPAENLVKQA